MKSLQSHDPLSALPSIQDTKCSHEPAESITCFLSSFARCSMAHFRHTVHKSFNRQMQKSKKHGCCNCGICIQYALQHLMQYILQMLWSLIQFPMPTRRQLGSYKVLLSKHDEEYHRIAVHDCCTNSFQEWKHPAWTTPCCTRWTKCRNHLVWHGKTPSSAMRSTSAANEKCTYQWPALLSFKQW